MHVMLDLETMSTAPNAAIIQIGAVKFDLEGDGILESPTNFSRTVALQSSMLAGGDVAPETIAWWRSQTAASRNGVTDDATSIERALHEFVSWLPAGAIIWAHGAAFDPPILQSAFRAAGMDSPWGHRDIRDTRTLFELARSLAGWTKVARETTHIAVNDATDQALDVQAAYKALAMAVLNNAVDQAKAAA